MSRTVSQTMTRTQRAVAWMAALLLLHAAVPGAAGAYVINTVVAELYTAVNGLGGLLSVYGNSFRMAPYFVVVCVLAAIGVLIMQTLKLLERRMERWRYRGDSI